MKKEIIALQSTAGCALEERLKIISEINENLLENKYSKEESKEIAAAALKRLDVADNILERGALLFSLSRSDESLAYKFSRNNLSSIYKEMLEYNSYFYQIMSCIQRYEKFSNGIGGMDIERNLRFAHQLLQK